MYRPFWSMFWLTKHFWHRIMDSIPFQLNVEPNKIDKYLENLQLVTIADTFLAAARDKIAEFKQKMNEKKIIFMKTEIPKLILNIMKRVVFILCFV